MKQRMVVCLCLACLLSAGCAFKHVRFDNNTTYEDKAHKIRMSGRDVRVSAQFTTHDAAVNHVQSRWVVSQDMASTYVGVSDDLDAAKGALARLESEESALRARIGEFFGANGLWFNLSIALDNRTAAVDPKKPGARLDFSTAHKRAFQEAEKSAADLGLPEAAETLKVAYDKITTCDAWKNFQDGLEKDDLALVEECRRALDKETDEVLNTSAAAVRKEAETRLTALKTEIEARDKEVRKLETTLTKLLPPGETPESLRALIHEARKNAVGPTVAGGVSGPAGLAVNLAKEMLDGKKTELTEAKEALNKIQELPMPALAKAAAVNAQKRAIQDIQGEYNEAVNDFLSVVSDVSAVTDYAGPGEVGTIWTMSLFGANDTIQRYPNGMVKSVGPNQYRKNLGTTITEEMFRTLRVLGIPASYVAGVVALAD